jgi:hypothetical protein
LAVGPEHVVAVVNVSFEIYDKDGSTLVPATSFASLFSGVAGCQVEIELFDPNVLYDESRDRFFLAIDGGGATYCAAVSQTADPTANWIRYAFPFASGSDFFDFPQPGVGEKAIFVGDNVFDCGNGCLFSRSRIWALDKEAMYAAEPAAAVGRTLGLQYFTPQPATLHGADQDTWPTDEPHAFATDTGFNGSTYSIFRWANPFAGGEPILVRTLDLQEATGVTPYFPIDVPQPFGGDLLANDYRPLDLEYRNGSLWLSTTIACRPAGAATVDCVRWAEIAAATGEVLQAGVLGTSGEYRFFGDMAVNHCGDMALGFSKTIPSIPSQGYPGVWMAGRSAADPAGWLSWEQAMRASNVEYQAFDGSPYRWGDYTAFTSDPNGLDLWYIGEYSKVAGSDAGRWGTAIGRLRYHASGAMAAGTGQEGAWRAYLPLVVGGGSQVGCP